MSEIRAVLAEMPPAEQWSLDETVAHILAMSEAERAVYYAALIHDWRAWRLAMNQFSVEGMTLWAATKRAAFVSIAAGPSRAAP